MIITIILAEGMDEGLRLIHFLTLIVKCSETRCWIYHSTCITLAPPGIVSLSVIMTS